MQVGINPAKGATIWHVSSSGLPAPWRDVNILNTWDCGRLLQQSYYGCPDGSCWAHIGPCECTGTHDGVTGGAVLADRRTSLAPCACCRSRAPSCLRRSRSEALFSHVRLCAGMWNPVQCGSWYDRQARVLSVERAQATMPLQPVAGAPGGSAGAVVRTSSIPRNWCGSPGLRGGWRQSCLRDIGGRAACAGSLGVAGSLTEVFLHDGGAAISGAGSSC